MTPENFEQQMSAPTDESVEGSTLRVERLKRVRAAIEVELDSAGNPEELASNLKKSLARYADLFDRPVTEIERDLDECLKISDREQLIDAVCNVILPIVIIQEKEPERYQAIAQKAFIEKGGFEQVNQLLAYNIDGDTLYLHIPPNEVTPLKEKLKLIKEGLSALAHIVNNNPAIQHIGGASWIVASHPSLMRRLGFVIEELDEKQRSLSHDSREVKLAIVSRKEFLARYLNK